MAAQISSGTAFAIAPGLLVSNQHVVAGCNSVDVIAPDGRRTGAILDADAQTDLALLRVSGIKGATARLRNPRNVRLGESVMVFGFPLAGALTSGGNFTSGHVSGLRGLNDAAGEIQITAPVQPGNSGGPVLDSSGLVIGVVQAKLDALRSAIATGDIPQNVNFAITLDVLVGFLNKNNVAFRSAEISKPLDTARVAELALGFTYRIECKKNSEETKMPPTARPPSDPPNNESSSSPAAPPVAEVSLSCIVESSRDPDSLGETINIRYDAQTNTAFVNGVRATEVVVTDANMTFRWGTPSTLEIDRLSGRFRKSDPQIKVLATGRCERSTKPRF